LFWNEIESGSIGEIHEFLVADHLHNGHFSIVFEDDGDWPTSDGEDRCFEVSERSEVDP
jgi:hypothetical protein